MSPLQAEATAAAKDANACASAFACRDGGPQTGKTPNSHCKSSVIPLQDEATAAANDADAGASALACSDGGPQTGKTPKSHGKSSAYWLSNQNQPVQAEQYRGKSTVISFAAGSYCEDQAKAKPYISTDELTTLPVVPVGIGNGWLRGSRTWP